MIRSFIVIRKGQTMFFSIKIFLPLNMKIKHKDVIPKTARATV